ncbi:cystathionine gamma-lyase [Ctenocephalides felis]|uniref:cystathionine gamma-lyase n=1 Tax=Ctenocephalides felis TaxID=7515 RepID=UPI000E6E510F|nr:cystathionine gamma-lyase [Ctenocephalides felis]
MSETITVTEAPRANTTISSSPSGFRRQPAGFETRAIHVGQEPEQWRSMALVPPITMSTTFKQDAPAEFSGYEYGRSDNPTRGVLERCLANLDGGKHGMCFSSGLGATTAIISMMSAGDHLISADDVYGGTNRFFSKVAKRMGIELDFVDATNPENVRKAIKKNTKMVWIESPTNPLLKVIDIRAVSDVVHEDPDIIVVVDNTFLSSYLQRPLELGADIVMYSLTKYMNGHSDVIMGAAITIRDDLHQRLRFLQNSMGIVPSPFDCSQVNRSLKTLALRMERHSSNSLAVAKFLEGHKHVAKVLHPGLPSHPQHKTALKQCYGHSGIMTFFLKGNLENAKRFFKPLQVFTLAESLGGYESLAELPSIMTHASVPVEQREQLGITDSLIRLSVGLESVDDLIKDLDNALNYAFE